MTFLTGFFLVFAGMSIGYLLWYRDRREEQQIQANLALEAEQAKSACASLQAEKTELEGRLVRQRSQINILQQLCEDWSASREQADRERAHLTVELEALKVEIEQLRNSLAECRQQLDEVTAQRDAAMIAEQSLLTSTAGLQTRLGNQESTIHKLREKHREAMVQLKQELENRQQLEAAHQEHCLLIEDRYKKQQQSLEQESSLSTTELLQQSNQLRQQLDQRNHQIGLLRAERDNLLLEMKQLRGNSAVKQGRGTTDVDLKHKPLNPLDTKLAEPVDLEIIPFSQAMEQRKQESYDAEYQGHTEKHPLLGIVYTEEPRIRDDLRKISGIAEVLEAKLNDAGIYTYRQIVAWSPEAIEEFGRMLKFKDRIVRDRWQEQANQLYQQKLANGRQTA